MKALSGWGRYPLVATEIVTPHTCDEARKATAATQGGVARGNGRAYGDAGVGVRQTLPMRALDRIRAFDPERGTVTVEAGVLIADLITTFLPRGVFPTVVPGTAYVTVGGAIAADVHGKNHHRDGGFGAHVESFVLATGGGQLLRVSRQENAELFAATVGGMGLTGTITEATLRLRRVETGWIKQQTIVAPDLDAAIAALDASDAATYSVAWIDGLAQGRQLGRSLIFLGEHAGLADLEGRASKTRFPPLRTPRVSVPIDVPAVCLNRWSVRAFNEIYFRRNARGAARSRLVPVGTYFFPLDAVGAWNRMYGRRGFVQYQCVVPLAGAGRVLGDILGRVAARGEASFLAVLKKLGSSEGLLSFPRPGYTLALDFPLRAGLLDFLEELDALVVAAGGRLYLAKDSRQSRATFEAGYPGLERFRELRRSVDPEGRVRSHLAERLGL
ncbi:Decaprenylphosphoryl-beta-D-ribose oxidase [Beijerinckiaceae bacterium RH AL1]|nr:FAD-binding oxidoreductase [Beijerinckiaceae bacterium]VVB42742.1 Decaprenylphosphoryl-beta-D-ribose oxidase [Beijerinckiaceae bacterium RH AL8]VVB42750.1 Decaprenylphosphoryl-beta-D-ribose oxidase [Beijerinckiaceae bacterium RH CH11]VVC53479.1 Decaprenylphosphoryl-beta-D-ribose oxidase [Beijerinckiaceae bacterium RH AL1]